MGDRNILIRICFILSLGTLMAAGTWAASPEDAPTRMTSVVRSDPRTGKLVRSLVVSARVVNQRSIEPSVIAPRAVAPAASAPAPETPVPSGINELVASIAAEHSLPPQLIHAVIKTESNYNTHAISPKG